ncbi:hypothetical protein D3C76_1217670 [compost metagenome]
MPLPTINVRTKATRANQIPSKVISHLICFFVAPIDARTANSCFLDTMLTNIVLIKFKTPMLLKMIMITIERLEKDCFKSANAFACSIFEVREMLLSPLVRSLTSFNTSCSFPFCALILIE